MRENAEICHNLERTRMRRLHFRINNICFIKRVYLVLFVS